MLHRLNNIGNGCFYFLCTVFDGKVKILLRVLDFAHIRHMKQSVELDRAA